MTFNLRPEWYRHPKCADKVSISGLYSGALIFIDIESVLYDLTFQFSHLDENGLLHAIGHGFTIACYRDLLQIPKHEYSNLRLLGDTNGNFNSNWFH
jgi:hypothetical protein